MRKKQSNRIHYEKHGGIQATDYACQTTGGKTRTPCIYYFTDSNLLRFYQAKFDFFLKITQCSDCQNSSF